MWPAALITSGAVAFGRLFVTGILPSAVITTVLWLAFRVDAFNPATKGLRLATLIPAGFGANQSGSLLLLALAVILLTAVLQGFHLAIVRLLEGYWGASRFALTLSTPGISRHRNRQQKALKEWDDLRTRIQRGLPEPNGSQRLNDQSVERRDMHHAQLRMLRARLRLEEYPPKQADLMPTRLGNVLRSGERRAGERYGWSTVHAWPRLYLGLPEPTVAAYRYSRDALDAAAIFCLTFLAMAIFTGVAFLDDPALLWWVSPSFLVLAYVSYRSALSSALTHGVILQAAFDRNRFDLFDSMHHPLPDTPEDEYVTARHISNFLAEAIDPETARFHLPGSRYSHAGPEKKRWLGWLDRLRSRLGRRHSMTFEADRAKGPTGP